MANDVETALKRSTGSEAPEPNVKPEWAVYIYMKPDLALEEFAERDIQEMAAGVKGAAFPVVVQVDQERDVQRLAIATGKATPIEASTWKPAGTNRAVVASVGFADFLRWAGARYPAKRRFVVLWGHSRGVGIDLIGPSAEVIDVSDAAAGVSPRPSGAPPADGLSFEELFNLAAVFPTAAQGVAPKSQELVSIDLLGLDSCYMSSAEFAHELSSRVGYLVAADGAVKRTGWNYRDVLGALSADPAITPAALAATIVEHVRHLGGDVSLARLDLQKSPALAQAFAALVAALRDIIIDPDEAHALYIMLKRTSYFQVRQFLDLRDLCQRLRAGFDGAVRDAADAMLRAYQDMVFARATGAALGRLNGVSIYCPLFRAQPPFRGDTPDVDAVVSEAQYEKLKFVHGTGWFALCRQLESRLDASRL
jgi:hypothetical protein